MRNLFLNLLEAKNDLPLHKGSKVILAIDVQYVDNTAYVAGVLFENWQSQVPDSEYVSILHNIAAYEPGQFYKRELPCITKLLEEHQLTPEIIVIDGYVYLDGEQKPGLGKYLFDSLNGQALIIGVAKKAFAGIDDKHQVIRGKSLKPLYVTSTGPLSFALESIATMFGDNRNPVLLKRADQLCREEADKCSVVS